MLDDVAFFLAINPTAMTQLELYNGQFGVNISQLMQLNLNLLGTEYPATN